MHPAFAHHRGVMVGFGLGLSVLSCDGCGDSEQGFGFDFNIGGFINPRLALMYDVGGWIHSEDGVTLGFATNAIAAQYWVAPQFWIKGGIGLATAQYQSDFGSDSESGMGVTAAAGYELMQSGNFALDISGRVGVMSFDNAPNFTMFNGTIGFRWK